MNLLRNRFSPPWRQAARGFSLRWSLLILFDLPRHFAAWRFGVRSAFIFSGLILATMLLGACGGDAPAAPLQKAANFTAKDLDGQDITLTQFQGQPVMLNFWASWCAPCRLEMPVIEAAYQKYKGQGLVILAINSGEPLEVAQAFVSENKLTFPVLLDQNLEVSNLIYRLRGLPVSIFIDREGNLVARHVGTLNERLLDEYVGKIVKSP